MRAPTSWLALDIHPHSMTIDLDFEMIGAEGRRKQKRLKLVPPELTLGSDHSCRYEEGSRNTHPLEHPGNDDIVRVPIIECDHDTAS